MAIISIVVLVAYICWTLKKCGGIADTLSETYYWLGKQGWVFQVMLAVFAGTLLPCWLDKSPDTITCLPFLACVSVVVIALCPEYLHGTKRKVHLTAAYSAAVFLVLWLVLAGLYLYIIYGLAFILLSALISKMTRGECHWWYWMEVAALLTASVAAI